VATHVPRRSDAPSQDRDRGALSVFIAITTLVAVLFLGAVVDFEQKLRALHDANIAAEEAARAGAGCIDRDRAYAGGGLVIDRRAAVYAVENYLHSGGYIGSVTAISDHSIRVHVTTSTPAVFLTVIGITTLHADASATADLTLSTEQEGSPQP
jgi:hypothetical protein